MNYTMLAICMLLGEKGKDWLPLDRDPEAWELYLYTRRN